MRAFPEVGAEGILSPMNDLKAKRVAVLVTDGFEQSELTEPVKALREVGATPV